MPIQDFLANGGLIRILTSYANVGRQSNVWIELGTDGQYHIVENEAPGSICVGNPPVNAFHGDRIFLPCRDEVLKYLIETLHLSESDAEQVVERIGTEPPSIIRTTPL